MSTIEEALKQKGLALPAAAPAAGSYVPVVVTGNLAFVAGQLPFKDGKLQGVGRVGLDFDVGEGNKFAETCALNILAQMKAALGGDLDRIVRIVKLVGFVNAVEGFTRQPEVINGASDLLVALLGPEKGQHARSAVSSPGLPLGAPVEIEAIVEIKS